MKKNDSYLLLSCLLLLNACSSIKKTPAAYSANTSLVNSGKAWTLLWQQRAAEYRALCFQAYNIARLRVDEALKQAPGRPFAIVTDIDETVLDNSRYDAGRAIKNLDYDDKTWLQWTSKAIADTIAGAPAFFKYAASKGISIYYISNRTESERVVTLKNLRLYNLPNADDGHLMLRQTSSGKEARRQDVLKTHTILLLCGDNLADFDLLYDGNPTEADRYAATQKLQKEFGSRYIIIPNPSYGDFEGALFHYNYQLGTAQKDSVIKDKLKMDR